MVQKVVLYFREKSSMKGDKTFVDTNIILRYLTKDDPPVFILHYAAANKDGNIHHPNFGKHLKKAMDALDIECVRKMDTDFKSRNEQYAAQVQFLKKHFGIQK